jgi:hypothetical protein
VEVARFENPAAAIALRDRLIVEGFTGAWIGLERVDGHAVHRVSVGTYADGESAAAALDEIGPRLVGLGTPVPSVSPVIP